MKKIKMLRLNKGITQQELANLLRIPRSTLTHYESGLTEMNYDLLLKMADIFDISVDELLGRVPEQQIFDDARVPKTEVQEIFDSLNPVQQELSLAYMKGLVEYNRKEELKKNQQTQNKRLA